jgi:uncharacterized coiled-coil protein SlyX
MKEREGLVARIRQVRRMTAARDRTSAEPAQSQSERLDALEARVTHLERLLEGLQDSVHREAERQHRLIAELQAKVAPSAMGAALAKEARERGL